MTLIGERNIAALPARWSCIFILTGGSLFGLALASQQSQDSAAFGLYSPLYMLLLLGYTTVWLSAVVALAKNWNRLPSLLEWVHSHLPAEFIYLVAVILVFGIAWLWSFPVCDVFSSVWARLGWIALLLGLGGFLIYRTLFTGFDVQPVGVIGTAIVGTAIVWVGLRLGRINIAPQFSVIIGPLVGYWLAVVAGRLQTYFQPVSLTSKLKRIDWVTSIMPVIGLAVLIAVAYWGTLRSGWFNNDEIVLVNFVYNRSLVQSLSGSLYRLFFRPLFQLQAFIDYRVFGLNYSGYVATQLVLLWASGVVLYFVFAKLSRSYVFAFGLAGLIVTYTAVSDLASYWAIDTATLTGLLAGLVAWWVLGRTWRPVDAGVLTVLLLLAYVSRENGIALAAGAGLMLVVGFGIKAINRSQAFSILAAVVLSFSLYFLLRQLWANRAFPGVAFVQETCLGFVFYSEQAIATISTGQQVLLALYNITAHFVAAFLPLFYNYAGCLQPNQIALWFGVAFVGLVWLGYGQKILARLQPLVSRLPPILFRLTGITSLYALGPVTLFGVASLGVLRADLIVLGLLSLIILYTLAWRVRLEPDDWVALSFGMGIIMGTAILTAFYFRYRNLYLPAIGWGIIAALCFGVLSRQGPTRRVLRGTLAVGVVLLLALNVIRLNKTLPIRFAIDRNSALCNPAIADELALELSRQYQVEDFVAQCRAVIPCNIPSPEAVTPPPLYFFDAENSASQC